MNKHGTIHILLMDEYLAVANKGRPFTKEGLRAICHAHLSPKGDTSDSRFTDKKDAENFLNEIRGRRIAAYRECSPDILEHAEAEAVLRNEYAGRILQELIQNAYDAVADRPIGNKGVGFKAVLNITNRPSIYSGALRCEFIHECTKEILAGEGLLKNSKQHVPLLRLPFEIIRDNKPSLITDLIQKYDTVIVLPFRKKESLEHFLVEWAKSLENETVLLFLPAIDRISWERQTVNGYSLQTWHRKANGEIIEIIKGDGAPLHWKVIPGKQASVALRLDGNRQPVPESKHPKIHAYFRTDESSPIPFLLHGDFPLKEGRSNILTADLSSKTTIDSVVEELVELVYKSLSQVQDPGKLIDFLRPRVTPEEMGTVERKLWEKIKLQVVKLEIPGSCGVCLGEVRLRPEIKKHGFDCELWNEFKHLVSQFRPGGLIGLPFTPSGVDTKEREETILLLNPMARLSEKELLDLPLFPIEGGTKPASSEKTNIFFPPKAQIPSSPTGIDVCFLDRHMDKALKEHPKSVQLQNFFEKFLNIAPFKPLTLVEKAILPVLRMIKQPEGLLDFLCSVCTPELKKDDLLFDWRNPVKKELAERCHIPTRDNRTMPAAYVYAGVEWTKRDFINQAYQNHSDRGFLKPPPENEEKCQQWENFYKWLGVGWCPKVFPIVCHRAEQKTKEGPIWSNNFFQIKDQPMEWGRYCEKTFDVFKESQRKARLRQNWFLDGGAEILCIDGAFTEMSDNWEYYSKYTEAIYYRSSNMREDYDNDRCSRDSYFMWLLKNTPWFPVKRISHKQLPHEVFSHSEIPRELTSWVFELDGKGSDSFLEAVNIRSGWRQITESDWKRWLDNAAKVPKEEVERAKENRDNIRRLYSGALRHWRPERHWGRECSKYLGHVWGVERLPDNTEAWQLIEGRKNIFFIDRPDLEPLRLPGLVVFPVYLNRLEKAAEDRFNLKMLSQHLKGSSEPTESCKTCEEQVEKRITQRLSILNAYLEATGRESGSSDKGFNHFEIAPKVMHELKILFSIDEVAFGDSLKVDAFYEPGNPKPTLWLDRSLFEENSIPKISVWEQVASGLVYAAELSLDVQGNIKDLLSYPKDELERKLIGLGVTKEQVDRIKNIPTGDMSPMSPLPPKEPKDEIPEVNTTRKGRNGGKGGGAGRGGASGGKRPAPKDKHPGREAQEWLRHKLQERLGVNEWIISEHPTQDEEGRETDIELYHSNFGKFHIEVKHMESGVIYWSEREVKKARDHKEVYFMAVLRRSTREEFEENWLLNPLEQLKEASRTGVWLWNIPEEKMLLTDAEWNVPTPRPGREATNFSFRIEISNDWLKQEGQDFKAVRSRLEQKK
jgi:hypothetical protein